jgi:SulP family sulfate permease
MMNAADVARGSLMGRRAGADGRGVPSTVSGAFGVKGLQSCWASYRRRALADDLVAAVIVTVLLVPQSLAYALLAGLPPIVGVMASLLPIVGYAAFGSSTALAVGPVAVLSMMTGAVIGLAAQAHGSSPHLVALVLCAEMALIFGLAVLLRLDVMASLLSAPVLHGFMTGASIAIALGQIPALLGVAVKGNTLLELAESVRHAPSLSPHAQTALIGVGSLLCLWAVRRYAKPGLARIGCSHRAAQLLARMGPMVVVIGAIACVVCVPHSMEGVALAGRIDLHDGSSFTPPWNAPLGLWVDMATPALMMALVAYVESLAVAEALAARRGEKIAPRRELLGLAVANAASSASGGMPVTGGFARSIVNFDAGAKTRVAGIWTALCLCVTIWLAGDLLGFLPKAVLAATIIVAVLSLVDLAPFAEAWRYARKEALLMIAVAAATVMLGVEPALAGGVLASAALLLQRTARPHFAEIGRVRGTANVFRNKRREDVETLPTALAIRVDESLVFTNTRCLVDSIHSMANGRASVEHVVLVMSGVNDIDFSGLEGIKALSLELKTQDITLHLSELKGPVADRLSRSGIATWLPGQVFRTQGDAHDRLARALPDIPLGAG